MKGYQDRPDVGVTVQGYVMHVAVVASAIVLGSASDSLTLGFLVSFFGFVVLVISGATRALIAQRVASDRKVYWPANRLLATLGYLILGGAIASASLAGFAYGFFDGVVSVAIGATIIAYSWATWYFWDEVDS